MYLYVDIHFQIQITLLIGSYTFPEPGILRLDFIKEEKRYI